METVETLNQRLFERYGNYSYDQRVKGNVQTNLPLFRIVFSEDQFEKRYTNYTKEGFFMSIPKVEEKPKYRHYIHHKYLLERLTAVPEFVETDLVEKLSYEPLWVFEDRHGNPLPPKWEVCEIVIDQVHRAAARAVGEKIEDPSKLEADPKIAAEVRLARIKRLEEEMFGNETDVGDSLAVKEAIVVPGPQKENDK